MSFVSLPMYDRPEVMAANDAFWQAIRAHLDGAPPEALTRDGDLWGQWCSPDLLLSQTCGYPYRAQLHDRVTLVGTPDYELPDCPPGHYYSVLIARRDDPRQTLQAFADAPFAYNDPLSQSGWAAPQNHAAQQGFAFRRAVRSGGHIKSAHAVAEARADIAAIDALSWQMIQRHDTYAGGLREVGRTAPTPALPYISALGRDADRLFDAIAAAIDTMPKAARRDLGLRNILRIPAARYLEIRNPPAPDSAAECA